MQTPYHQKIKNAFYSSNIRSHESQGKQEKFLDFPESILCIFFQKNHYKDSNRCWKSIENINYQESLRSVIRYATVFSFPWFLGLHVSSGVDTGPSNDCCCKPFVFKHGTVLKRVVFNLLPHCSYRSLFLCSNRWTTSVAALCDRIDRSLLFCV